MFLDLAWLSHHLCEGPTMSHTLPTKVERAL